MADSIQPNFIKQNADGTVAAVFSGGVELTPADLSKSQQPEAENSIQWTRQADGALVAEVYSQVQDPGGIVGAAGTQIITYDPESKGGSLFLAAQQSPSNRQKGSANVSISSGQNGYPGQVSASANDTNGNQQFRNIIDGNGNTDFATIVARASGSGNCTYRTVTVPQGFYLIVLRATGPNIDDNLSYFWQVHAGNVQSSVIVVAHSYFNNTPVWGVGWGGEATLTMGQSASMGYVSSGAAGQVGFNTTNANVSSWAYSITRLSAFFPN